MTPENTPNPMDATLRRYAQTRRQQAGPPFELHSADKEALLAEARRVYPGPSPAGRPWWAFWATLSAPRWAMAAAVVLCLGLVVYSLWLSDKPTSTILAQHKDTGVAATRQTDPAAAPATSEPPASPPVDGVRKTESDQPSASPPLERQVMEQPTAVAALHSAETPRETPPPLRRAPAEPLRSNGQAALAQSDRREAETPKTAEDRSVALAGRDGALAPAAPPPSAAGSTQAPAPLPLRGAPGGARFAAPEEARFASPAPPAGGVGGGVQEGAAARATAPTPVELPDVKGLADYYLAQQRGMASRTSPAEMATQQRGRQSVGAEHMVVMAQPMRASEASGAAKTQVMVRAAKTAKATPPPEETRVEKPGTRYAVVNETISDALPVVFNLWVSNEVVHVVDADGTVYEGRLTSLPQPVAAPAARRQTMEKAGARDLLMTQGKQGPTASARDDLVRPRQQFQISGRHPRLQEEVSLTGDWPPAPDGGLRLQMRVGNGPVQTLLVRPVKN